MSCHDDICGEWEDEQETPTGQCSPRRIKTSCDAPTAYLNDTSKTVEIPCPEGTIGEVVSFTVSVGQINNPFSVSSANTQAQAAAQAGAEALRASIPCLYPNQEQQCTETCPDGMIGDPITVVIEAGDPRFNSLTQEAANAAALSAACEEAAAQRAESPCQEPTLASISSECQKKEGGCTGITYTLDGVPFDGLSICGTATSCADAFGQFAQACASCSVAGVTIVDGYPEFTFNNFQWNNTLQIFSLGCGISGSHPAQGPGIISADANGATDAGDISAAINDLHLTSNPAMNPYVIGMTIIFDLVGTHVAALPTQLLDLSLLQTEECWENVEEDETEWSEASCDLDVAYVEQDGEDFDYLILQTRYVLGLESPLVIGQNYRITTIFSRRAVNTSDPFVEIEEDEVLEFQADATTDTTDWITVPNENGFETKISSFTIEEI